MLVCLHNKYYTCMYTFVFVALFCPQNSFYSINTLRNVPYKALLQLIGFSMSLLWMLMSIPNRSLAQIRVHMCHKSRDVIRFSCLYFGCTCTVPLFSLSLCLFCLQPCQDTMLLPSFPYYPTFTLVRVVSEWLNQRRICTISR